jgi:hypothetical protein
MFSVVNQNNSLDTIHFFLFTVNIFTKTKKFKVQQKSLLVCL